MNVLFDTNVVLDVLLERQPHVDTCAKLFALVDHGRIRGSICVTTATTIFYIAVKSLVRHKARQLVRSLLDLFEVAAVDREVLVSALALDFGDYEDAVLHEAARVIGADAIVTRDYAGFLHGTVPVLDPIELLAVVAAPRP